MAFVAEPGEMLNRKKGLVFDLTLAKIRQDGKKFREAFQEAADHYMVEERFRRWMFLEVKAEMGRRARMKRKKTSTPRVEPPQKPPQQGSLFDKGRPFNYPD